MAKAINWICALTLLTTLAITTPRDPWILLVVPDPVEWEPDLIVMTPPNWRPTLSTSPRRLRQLIQHEPFLQEHLPDLRPIIRRQLKFHVVTAAGRSRPMPALQISLPLRHAKVLAAIDPALRAYFQERWRQEWVPLQTSLESRRAACAAELAELEQKAQVTPTSRTDREISSRRQRLNRIDQAIATQTQAIADVPPPPYRCKSGP